MPVKSHRIGMAGSIGQWISRSHNTVVSHKRRSIWWQAIPRVFTLPNSSIGKTLPYSWCWPDDVFWCTSGNVFWSVFFFFPYRENCLSSRHLYYFWYYLRGFCIFVQTDCVFYSFTCSNHSLLSGSLYIYIYIKFAYTTKDEIMLNAKFHKYVMHYSKCGSAAAKQVNFFMSNVFGSVIQYFKRTPNYDTINSLISHFSKHFSLMWPQWSIINIVNYENIFLSTVCGRGANGRANGQFGL